MSAADTGLQCMSCGSERVRTFYEVKDVPTNSVLLLDTRDDALQQARGNIQLGHCLACGHIHNTAFSPALTEYSDRYESTQAYSPTFNQFHRRLARDVIERFDVRGKHIIEIGCGNGEFLALLCQEGHNSGLGFDPAHLEGRVDLPAEMSVEFVADWYSEKYADCAADFVACKMTLEHIIDTRSFVRTVRDSIGDRFHTDVMFQVPNARRVFGDCAFWDVYYEHCSYFTHGSLARLFRQERFEVFDLWSDYGDQYLMVAARPATESTAAAFPDEFDLADIQADVDRFAADAPRRIDTWRRRLAEHHSAGRVVVLWGGGSKGVAFLTTVGVTEEVAAVVDINPNKSDTYMAGTGHRIVGPEALVDIQPDVVVAMNSVYLGEIAAELDRLGVEATLVGLD